MNKAARGHKLSTRDGACGPLPFPLERIESVVRRRPPRSELAWPDRERCTAMLRTMLRIRHFEEKAMDLSSRGEAPGSVHPYVGQEAIAAGVGAAMRDGDYLTSTHRGHGHCIARGADLGAMFAELLGRRTGSCRGKGGSMHIADVKRGILGANGIAGGGPPIAVGAALGARVRGSEAIVVSFFGDGTANEGSVHEAMNMAACHELPVVFVCENNLYSISVPASRALAVGDVAVRGLGYGMASMLVDGQDCTAVYAAATEAVQRACGGGGPSLIECKTYSFKSHSTVSRVPRPKREMAEWQGRDPIDVLCRQAAEAGFPVEEDVRAVRAEVEHEVAAALEWAMAQAEPEPEALLEDVYAAGKEVG